MLGLIPLALKLGIPARFAKVAVIGTLIVLLVAGLGIAKCSYDRSVIRAHEAKAALEQAKRERKADTNLNINKGRDEAAAQQRREEIDNATKDLADKAPSERQRARACIELRRQAKAQRRPAPAC